MNLYNTLTKQIEPFIPRDEGKVDMFVCGPTVYDYSHLGHAKTYVQLDLLARVLRASDYEVFYLQNITDIDDKIIDRARERGINWEDLRSQYQNEYEQDMKSLHNVSVSQYARATDHIDDIIRQVQTLLDKGNAYKIDGDGIYFEISTFPEYGKLSGRSELKKDDAQSRIDESNNKKGWNDFALWKFSKPGEPVWNAPFGDGRPGWHIEDTAITEHYFGPQYDLHGGAVDLIFPHHEAEITQMEAASGLSPFVRTWVHTGFLTIEGEKMSKSVGNFYTIREVLEKGYDPMAIRLFMLQSHYRSAVNFTYDNLDKAANRLRNQRAAAAAEWQFTGDTPGGITAELITEAIDKILSTLQDDLASPRALEALDSILDAVDSRSFADEAALLRFKQAIDQVHEILGIDVRVHDISDEQKKLIALRLEAKQAQDWQRSDAIRDELSSQGIGLRDTALGTRWYPL